MPSKRGDSWSCHHRFNGKRLRITLGRITKADAMIADGHIGRIIAAANENISPPAESIKWLKKANRRIRTKFQDAGISILERQRLTVSEVVSEFMDEYEANEKLADRTIVRMRQSSKMLTKYFKNKNTDEVGIPEAKEFSKWLRKQYPAESTWSKALQRCRQIFSWAVDHELITRNPLRSVKGGKYANDDRQFYVSSAVMKTILDQMPNGDFKIAAALGRYGGLRLPSELADLTWDRVNLPKRVVVVWDVKRKRDRVMPIFPELFGYLQEHWELFGAQSEYVIIDPLHRDPDANLRTTFGKYVTRAGQAKWPRLMQNLRASCETDLLKKFPIHQVVKWIGNSPGVALKHYAMVSDHDIAMAAAQPLIDNTETNEELRPICGQKSETHRNESKKNETRRNHDATRTPKTRRKRTVSKENETIQNETKRKR